jgi:8-oxo-dGTP pyrophosphatase MutT (NUDIX family)
MGAKGSKKAVWRRPAVVGRTTMATGRFLELRTLSWVDRAGNERKWESADRVGDQRAVLMIARLMPSDRLVLIKQYRPPVGSYVVEFPAGLIDGDEAPEAAAMRELMEETGYEGEVRSVSPFAVSSPGMTGEGVALVEIRVDETLPENAKPIARPDAGEDIALLLVRRRELGSFVAAQAKAGAVIDSKVVAYALGMGVEER